MRRSPFVIVIFTNIKIYRINFWNFFFISVQSLKNQNWKHWGNCDCYHWNGDNYNLLRFCQHWFWKCKLTRKNRISFSKINQSFQYFGKTVTCFPKSTVIAICFEQTYEPFKGNVSFEPKICLKTFSHVKILKTDPVIS